MLDATELTTLGSRNATVADCRGSHSCRLRISTECAGTYRVNGENWEVRNLTLQRYSDETKWRYLLRLRDVSGTGLHLTRLVRSFLGVDFYSYQPQSATIDLRIEPNGSLEIPCWETLYRGSFGAHGTSSDLQVRKTFSGEDGSGRPVTFAADLVLDLREPPERARVFEFAKFTDHAFATLPQPPYCETVPNGISVVDRTQAQGIYLLVGTDNGVHERSGPPVLRTRWTSPNGDEVKVIESRVLTLGLQKSGIFLYETATHSIPRELFSSRPGVWKVEVIVNGQSEGVYTIQVI